MKTQETKNKMRLAALIVWKTKREKAVLGEVRTIKGKERIRVRCKAGHLQWKLVKTPEIIKPEYTKSEAKLFTAAQRRRLRAKGCVVPDIRGLHFIGWKQTPEHIEHRRQASRKYLFDALAISKEQKKRIRKSLEYKTWRRLVFENDGYTCQTCKDKSGNGHQVFLEAHHKKSFTNFPNLRFDISNGVTLCRKCHRKESSHQMQGNKNGRQKASSGITPTTQRP